MNLDEYKSIAIHWIALYVNGDNVTYFDSLKYYLEEQLLIKYSVIKFLIVLKIQNMTHIKEVLLQWFINFMIKIPLVLILQVVLLHVQSQKPKLREINLLLYRTKN